MNSLAKNSVGDETGRKILEAIRDSSVRKIKCVPHAARRVTERCCEMTTRVCVGSLKETNCAAEIQAQIKEAIAEGDWESQQDEFYEQLSADIL